MMRARLSSLQAVGVISCPRQVDVHGANLPYFDNRCSKQLSELLQQTEHASQHLLFLLRLADY